MCRSLLGRAEDGEQYLMSIKEVYWQKIKRDTKCFRERNEYKGSVIAQTSSLSLTHA